MTGTTKFMLHGIPPGYFGLVAVFANPDFTGSCADITKGTMDIVHEKFYHDKLYVSFLIVIPNDQYGQGWLCCPGKTFWDIEEGPSVCIIKCCLFADQFPFMVTNFSDKKIAPSRTWSTQHTLNMGPSPIFCGRWRWRLKVPSGQPRSRRRLPYNLYWKFHPGTSIPT